MEDYEYHEYEPITGTSFNNVGDIRISIGSDLLGLKVEQCLISTKHKALIVNDKSTKIEPVQCATRKSVQIRDHTPLTSNLLQQSLASYN